VVRTTGDPATLSQTVAEAVAAIDPHQPIADVATMASRFGCRWAACVRVSCSASRWRCSRSFCRVSGFMDDGRGRGGRNSGCVADLGWSANGPARQRRELALDRSRGRGRSAHVGCRVLDPGAESGRGRPASVFGADW